MTFAVLRQQIDDIVTDLGPVFWKPAAEEASVILRDVITRRLGGRHVDYTLHWTLTEDADAVQAAAELKALFSEKTGERIVGLAKYRGSQISLRATGVWADGKVYRARLGRMWSYSPGEGQDMRWAAEITAVGRVAAGGWRTALAQDAKKWSMDAPSEYLAEKGMRGLFEKQFRVEFAA